MPNFQVSLKEDNGGPRNVREAYSMRQKCQTLPREDISLVFCGEGVLSVKDIISELNESTFSRGL